MFLINYSKDILYLVLAGCVLWLAFILTLLFYHLIAAARQLHKTIRLLKAQVDEVADFIGKIKMAIEMPASIASLVLDGLKKITAMGAKATAETKTGSKKRPRKNG